MPRHNSHGPSVEASFTKNYNLIWISWVFWWIEWWLIRPHSLSADLVDRKCRNGVCVPISFSSEFRLVYFHVGISSQQLTPLSLKQKKFLTLVETWWWFFSLNDSKGKSLQCSVFCQARTVRKVNEGKQPARSFARSSALIAFCGGDAPSRIVSGRALSCTLDAK